MFTTGGNYRVGVLFIFTMGNISLFSLMDGRLLNKITLFQIILLIISNLKTVLYDNQKKALFLMNYLLWQTGGFVVVDTNLSRDPSDTSQGSRLMERVRMFIDLFRVKSEIIVRTTVIPKTHRAYRELIIQYWLYLEMSLKIK